jgi:hypothetical protein
LNIQSLSSQPARRNLFPHPITLADIEASFGFQHRLEIQLVKTFPDRMTRQDKYELLKT